jgi:hypothetical protein
MIHAAGQSYKTFPSCPIYYSDQHRQHKFVSDHIFPAQSDVNVPLCHRAAENQVLYKYASFLYLRHASGIEPEIHAPDRF